MTQKNRGGRGQGQSYQRVTVASVKSGASKDAASPKSLSVKSPVPAQFLLKVTLREDLHSGTGHTAGHLDGVQLKDRDGDPMIFRGHLKGLLREVADDLVALGHAMPEEVSALFGAPNALGRGALSMTSLYVQNAGGALVEWTSAARKKDERGPAPDMLRTVEHVGAGTVFNALFELMSGPTYVRQKDLAEHCFKRLIALGSGRAVGDGRIMTAVSTLTSVPRPFAVSFAGKLRSRLLPETGKLRLRLVIRSLDPTCFPATGYPGNLIFSESFLRGAAHQGAWVGCLAELGHDASWLLEKTGPAFHDAVP